MGAYFSLPYLSSKPNTKDLVIVGMGVQFPDKLLKAEDLEEYAEKFYDNKTKWYDPIKFSTESH